MHVGDDASPHGPEPLDRRRPRPVERVQDAEPVPLHSGSVLAHAPGLDAIARQHGGGVARRRDQGQAQPEVPVLERGQPLVESARHVEDGSPDERRDRGNEIAVDQLGKEPAVEHASPVAEALRCPRPGPGRHRLDEHVAVGPPHVRLALEHRDLLGELRRRQDVVGIEERDVGAARGGEPRVAGGRQAPIGLPEDADPAAVAPQDGRRVVGRAVVDHDDVDGVERLRERAVDRLGEKSRVVERGDDEAHAHRMTS